MPNASDNILTMADVVRIAKDPAARSIIEIMNQTNEIISDAPTMVCNNGTTHKTTLRDDIPFPRFRMINQGVPVVKSAVRQTTEHTGMLANWVQVDREQLKLSGNAKQVMLNESRAIFEGMAQAGAEAIFYGDHELDHAAFDGFTPRYNNLNPDMPQSRNIIDMGGTGSNLTSIWLIQWDPAACHLLYPEGTSAGVKHEVFNDQILRDIDGLSFPGIMAYYYWYLGLAVRDWRRCVRICNIDTNMMNDIIENGATNGPDFRLTRSMLKAIDLLPYKMTARTMFYMNRIPHTMLNLLASEKSNVQLTYETVQGQPPLTRFCGIPLRRCDGLHIGEYQVVSF